jgi:hypothetical protein
MARRFGFRSIREPYFRRLLVTEDLISGFGSLWSNSFMLSLALLFACAATADLPPEVDLAFRTPGLAGWECNGFEIVADSSREASSNFMRVTSRNALKDGRALLHTALKIPSGTKEVHFFAGAVRTSPGKADQELDVLMYAAGKRLIPKRIQTQQGWMPVDHIQASDPEQLREYSWNVEALVGKTVRIALLDDDPRPDCHVVCSGFLLISDDRTLDRIFERRAREFQSAHHLKPLIRIESQHFLALSNTESAFNELRLGNCELLYSSFMQHFRAKGFRPKEPAGKLHAIFLQTQKSFSEYCESFGRKVSPMVTGIYFGSDNALVTYDFATNPVFVASKLDSAKRMKFLNGVDEREQYNERMTRRAEEFRRGANISTIMHETSHQMSFNTGLLNRAGDMPAWLVEGLATYCEATRQGVWMGIGEPNPERLNALQKVIDGKRKFIPLISMVSSDSWYAPRTSDATILLGYAQSWALFHWLMEEKPGKMAEYFKVLAVRRTHEHRLADFQQAFGRDLKALQNQYEDHMKKQVARVAVSQR